MTTLTPSISALHAFSTQLTTTADNLANIQTNNYQAQQVHLVELRQGGVSAIISRDLTPGPSLPSTFGSPHSNEYQTGSNTDVVQEILNLTITRRAYQANARVLATMDALKGQILDTIE